MSAIDELQCDIFSFLVSRKLPLVPNVEHPSILIRMNGRKLIVSQIETRTCGREGIFECKKMPATAVYTVEYDLEVW